MAVSAAVLGSIIAAGASAAAAGTQTAIGASANKRAYKWGKKMFDYQADYSLPSAQMSRFTEAGLNPNLMYGQGTPGNVDFKMPSDQTDVSALGRISPEALQMMQMGANIEKTQAETNLINGKSEQQKWINDFNNATDQLQKDMVTGKLAEIVASVQGKTGYNAYEYGVKPEDYMPRYYVHNDDGDRIYFVPPYSYGNEFSPSAARKNDLLKDNDLLVEARTALVSMQKELAEKNKEWMELKIELQRIYNENEEALQNFRQFNPWFDSLCKALGIVSKFFK